MAGFAAPGRVCDGVVMAWIELDGAVNVRDLGDMPTEDGQKTARGRLLRADNLQDLSAAVKEAASQNKCYADAMKDIKLPKYESWPNYNNFLPMNIERYCDYYNRGI